MEVVLSSGARDPASDSHPGLPARDYFAPEVYELEKERLFYRHWFCVGREEELPETGAFVTRDVADESVLVLRAGAGDLRAFYNVCRHRGTRLCEEPAGRLRGGIVCPYHAWSYALDGRLLRTPNVAADGALDRGAFGLRGVALDVFDGFLFVNLGPDPRPLRAQLADEPAAPLAYARYRTGELRTAHRIVYEVKANWKIIHDNYNECLHCPILHPELAKIVPLYRRGLVLDPARADGGATLDEGLHTFTHGGRSRLPALPGLSELDRRTYYGYSLLPNLLVNLLSTGVMSYTLYPRSADHTTIVSEYLFRPEVISAAGFDCGDMVEFLDLVSVQDWGVCERAQRGLRSRGFVQGVYPPPDALLHAFAQRYLAERGPLPDASVAVSAAPGSGAAVASWPAKTSGSAVGNAQTRRSQT
jgi:Rieske 2Fe-2S family protein